MFTTLFVHIHLCLPSCLHVYTSLPMFTPFFLCLLMLPMSTNVYSCLPILEQFTRASLPMFAYV